VRTRWYRTAYRRLKEQGDCVRILRKHRDRSIAVIYFICTETRIFENACDIHEDERIIVNGKRIGDC